MEIQENFFFNHRPIDPYLSSSLIKLGKKKNKVKILDLGCGDGSTISDLEHSELFKKTFDIYGADISKSSINLAKKRNLKTKFLVGDVRNLSFKNKSFDFIYSLMVIEHIENPSNILNEIKRLLKPNGRCFVTTVMKGKGAWYFYKNIKGERVLDPTHLYEFKSEIEFKKMLKKAGLKVISFRKVQTSYSLIELVLKFLIRLNLLKDTLVLRNIFSNNRFLSTLQNTFIIKIPRYFHLEVLCQS